MRGAGAVQCFMCAGQSEWAVSAMEGCVVAFGCYWAVWGVALVCCGLMLLRTHFAACFFEAAFLVVPVCLAFVTL